MIILIRSVFYILLPLHVSCHSAIVFLYYSFFTLDSCSIIFLLEHRTVLFRRVHRIFLLLWLHFLWRFFFFFVHVHVELFFSFSNSIAIFRYRFGFVGYIGVALVLYRLFSQHQLLLPEMSAKKTKTKITCNSLKETLLLAKNERQTKYY